MFSKILNSNKHIKLFLLVSDLMLLLLSYIISWKVKTFDLNEDFFLESKIIFIISVTLWILLVYLLEAYMFLRIERIESLIKKTGKLVFYHLVITCLIIVLLNLDGYKRFNIIILYTFFLIFLVFSRTLFNHYLKKNRSKGKDIKKIIIVGINKNSYRLSTIIQEELTFGYNIVGYFDYKKNKKLKENYLGDINSISQFIEENLIDEIFVSLSIEESDIISDLIRISEKKAIRIKIIPDFNAYTKTRNISIDFYGEIPILMLRNEPLENSKNRILKQIFDILFSLLVIITIFPWLLPIISIMIKFGSGGPVFFVQKRTGENNKTFNCIKFRTMRVNKNSDSLQATKFDVRITKLGKFMRKTNIDELPQFFNVLFGSMSVVGPRPHMLKHTEQYSELINNYLVRHLARPGITGWAQVNGYRGETKELIDMRKRVIYDIWYIENWSFLLDLKIIIQTITNIFKGEKNAY